MSIWLGSLVVGFSSTAGAACGMDGGRYSGQSRLLSECASPLLEVLAGLARKQASMALRFSSLGHEGLGQWCLAFVCWREHNGRVGSYALPSG